jgi:hypothetical protein
MLTNNRRETKKHVEVFICERAILVVFSRNDFKLVEKKFLVKKRTYRLTAAEIFL